MADYADLESLIGPLKRAAIDAYICSESFLGIWGFKINGDEYSYTHPSTGYWGPNVERISRPDANGEGGGGWQMHVPMAPDPDDEPNRYVDDFDNIRSRIDTALEPWKDLPDPTDIAAHVELVRQANRLLAFEAVASNGTVTGGGEIGGNLNLAMENSDAMAGGLITAFKANFMSQLGKAIGGHHAITVVLGGFLAAEEKIWEGARQGVVDLVVETTKAFDAAAAGNGPDWELILKVAGYAAAGAAIFASGGAATALAVAGLGIKILDAEVPKSGESTDAPDGDYKSVMETFEKVLSDMDSEITKQEEEMETNMTTNQTQVNDDSGSYNLRRPAVIDIRDDSDLGVIQIDEVLALEITGTYLPNVAKELKTAVGYIDDVLSLTPIQRDSSIGVGMFGPSGAYYGLRGLLETLLGELEEETRLSARALDLGIKDMKVLDTDQKDALERFADKLIEDAKPDPAPVTPPHIQRPPGRGVPI